MLRCFIAILLISAGALPAQSGAWLRDVDQRFSSTTATLRSTDGAQTHELSYYTDYGLLPWLTLGLDLNDNGTSGHVLAFARVPWGDQPPTRHVAAELAVGSSHYLNNWHPMYKLTLSYGRALDSRWGPGWLAVDAAYEKRGDADASYKLDTTLGLNDPRHIRPMLQIELTQIPAKPLFYTITPSILFPLKRNTQVQVGIEHRVTTQRSLGLKIGLWRRF